MGIIKTILIIALIYYATKFVVKTFAPVLIAKFFRSMANNAAKQHEEAHHKSQTKVGETIIDSKPTSHEKPNKNVGEYIDFEEVKE